MLKQDHLKLSVLASHTPRTTALAFFSPHFFTSSHPALLPQPVIYMYRIITGNDFRRIRFSVTKILQVLMQACLHHIIFFKQEGTKIFITATINIHVTDFSTCYPSSQAKFSLLYPVQPLVKKQYTHKTVQIPQQSIMLFQVPYKITSWTGRCSFSEFMCSWL